MKGLAIRLKPGEDLRQTLLQYCIDKKIDAACIVSCVGSLLRAKLRFADKQEAALIEKKLEIVSLVGTLSQHGIHLHIAVSDGEGKVIGGHLLDGSPIYTTAEIVLGIIPQTILKRELDPTTGFKELRIISN